MREEKGGGGGGGGLSNNVIRTLAVRTDINGRATR